MNRASFLFCNDTPPPDIYTLSLHDALPISPGGSTASSSSASATPPATSPSRSAAPRRSPICSSPRRTRRPRSEEHTSELQSQFHLVCRLLLEKKKITCINNIYIHNIHDKYL